MTGNIGQQLEREGFYVSTTVGLSMWPMLKNRRDRVVLRPLEEGERLKRGDVPLYRHPSGKYILHRILRVEADGTYIIRGDNTYALERVPKEWIVGVLKEFYRKGKHVSVESRGYRLYATLWRLIFPVRYLLFWARRILGKIKRMIFGSKNNKNNP